MFYASVNGLLGFLWNGTYFFSLSSRNACRDSQRAKKRSEGLVRDKFYVNPIFPFDQFMASSSRLIQRKNWFENHPQFLAIKAHGYDKHNPFTSRSAMLVYLELCESKHWFGVEIHFSDKLKRVYLTGKPRKKADKEIIVPLSVNLSLTVKEIQDIVSEIQQCVRDVPEYSSRNLGVTLGICDSDSSIVYYKVYNGLVEPDPPNSDNDGQDGDNIFELQIEKK